MEKIISLYRRNYDGNRLIRNEIVEGAEWVPAGEGIATRKFDGTCCRFKDGVLYKRYDAKKGKIPPPDFEPAQAPDSVTGHWPGWVPVSPDNPADRWHLEALQTAGETLTDGTYELCGPKVQGNPEGFEAHLLIPHGKETLHAPRGFDGLREFFKAQNVEGIVWHHPDGRMVKIKARDYGLKRPQVVS